MAKLVEILARELKEWKSNADGAVFSSKGGACYFFHGNRPAHDDHYWRATEGCFWFVDEKDKITFDADTPEDCDTAIVTRAEWQAAVDALKGEPEIIGHWHPKESNSHQKPFAALSKRESPLTELGKGCEGEKEGGKEYHVLYEYWEWKPIEKVAPEWDGVGLPPVGVSCERRFPDVRGSSWNGCIILAHGARRIFVRDNCGDEWAPNIDEVEFRPFRTPEQIAADERESAINGMLTHDALGGSRRGLAEALYDAGYRKQEPK